jgi:signal transduction histidine kinase
LARALGDPTLQVGYWAPAVPGFADAIGEPLALPSSQEDRVVTTIDGGDGEPIAAIVHHRSLLDDPALAAAVATAAELSSVNARLRSVVRDQAAAIDASRRRLVTAADDEQRRLADRLHSGAQRRLEALASRIGAARVDADETSRDLLADLGARVAEALDEISALASGLRPPQLTDRGLSGALEELTARCPTPVELTVDVGRIPDPLEMAIYFVCSEALANVVKHAKATSVVVDVSGGARGVTVAVTDDGVGGAEPRVGSGLHNLLDRIEALGGTLRIESGGGTRLVAELPLGDECC